MTSPKKPSKPSLEELPATSTPDQPEEEVAYNQLMRQAYTAYCAAVDYKSLAGDSLPLFDELPLACRSAWLAVAKEIVAQLP